MVIPAPTMDADLEATIAKNSFLEVGCRWDLRGRSNATDPRRGGVKGSAKGVGGDLLQLTGDNGGEHGAADRQQELDLRQEAWTGRSGTKSPRKDRACTPQLCLGCSREPPRLSAGASAQQPCRLAMPNLMPSLRIARS